MFLSVLEMFKVGVGPSSSHTMGPMVAAGQFLDLIRQSPFAFHGVKARLHGSQAFTGVGHSTDRATILGLAGFNPESYDAEKAELALADINDSKQLTPAGLNSLRFDPEEDLIYDYGRERKRTAKTINITRPSCVRDNYFEVANIYFEVYIFAFKLAFAL